MPASVGEGESVSRLTLITGGARSGKSHFAELLAQAAHLQVTYVATAQTEDEEMARRVEKHRLRRPSHWGLVEEPYDLRHVLRQHAGDRGLLLVDCITVWLSNLLLREISPFSSPMTVDEQENAMDTLLRSVQEVAELAVQIQPQVILVTNEVGQGIVPEYPLSRLYRDLSGKANQLLAQASENTYLVIAGYPLEIKTAGEALLRKLARED